MDNNLQFAFRKIYQENLWGGNESRSGPGSSMAYTEDLRRDLPVFLKMLDCKTLLDAPCGDFNWMRSVELDGINYIGADIVPEIIEQNRKNHASDNRRFEVLDVITDPLPEADVWLCRDLMLHLPLLAIMQLLRQFLNSNIKYFFTSHYQWSGDNSELYSIVLGSCINLTKRPFLLPEPLYTIKDYVEPGSHRSIGVWLREQILGEFKRQEKTLRMMLGTKE